MRTGLLVLVMVVALGIGAVPARAGYVMSYVSTAGTDSGACERPAPCKTLNYAVAQTGAGGEVVILDSGTYAPATITRAVEIAGAPGVRAVISAPTTFGITVRPGAGKDVTLRNLVIRGKNQASNGINITSGELELRGVRITRFGGHGVNSDVPATSDDDLTVVDSEIARNGGSGIWTEPGVSEVTVRGSHIDRNGRYGIRLGSGARNVTVTRSQITRNQNGGVYDNDGGGTGTITVAHSELNRNSRGAGYGIVGSWGRIIRVKSSELRRNQWALSAYGGATVEVRDSDISHNAWGVLFSANGSLTRGIVESSSITHNSHGIWPEGGTVRVGRSTLAYNETAMNFTYGGTVYSYGDNAVHDNAGGQTFSGVVGRS